MNKSLIRCTYTHLYDSIWLRTSDRGAQTVTADRFYMAHEINRRAMLDGRHAHAYINTYQYWTLR